MFEHTEDGLYYTNTRGKKVRLTFEPIEIVGDEVRLPPNPLTGAQRIVKKPQYRSATPIIRWLCARGVRLDPRYPTAFERYFANAA